MPPITSNAKQVERKIRAVAQNLSKDVLKATLFAALEEVANTSTAKYFKKTSVKESLSYAPIAGRITNRTLRLIGSVSGGFRFSNNPIPSSVSARMRRKTSVGGGSDLEKGKKESIREVHVTGTQLQGIIGSKGPYAALHEFGGKTKSKVTGKMRSFFWAKWYETNNSKWKGMALGAWQFIRSTIPARPFLQPAVKDSRQVIMDLFNLQISPQII